MILLRYKKFSNNMIDKLTEKLKQDGIEDFEVDDRVPMDTISVTGDVNRLKIYIPTDLENFQYDIDDFIRTHAKFVRTNTNLERNIFVMKLNNSLTFQQYCKLVEYIIEEQGFCTIVNI